jgi:hypothetical protein
MTSTSLNLALAATLAAFSLVACAASTDAAEQDPQSTEDTSQDLSASSCRGILPHTCEVCSNGKTACAHWVMKNKKCTVQVCR